MDNLENKSRFLSLILRHNPDVIGIKLDEHGFANVDELIDGFSKQEYIDMKILEEIVKTDDKKRYSFNEDKTLIRANQGHSINVDVELEKKIPSDVLFHGTGIKYLDSILEQGLIPKSRLYVHLSSDIETAIKVGKRHGEVVVFEINTNQMIADGFDFFISSNGVWLVKNVPVKYLKKIDKIE